MSKSFEQIEVALHIMSKGAEINRAREIASKRHGLAESEFEALLKQNNAAAEQIEAGRAKMISLYEQYVDACLALRTFSLEAEKRIEAMIKEHKQ